MGKRLPLNFRKTDLARAVESARTSGIEPRMVEVVTKDGTTFRVFGDKAPEVQAAHASAAAVTLSEGRFGKVFPYRRECPVCPQKQTNRETSRDVGFVPLADICSGTNRNVIRSPRRRGQEGLAAPRGRASLPS
jgi:hypothetical protein